MKSAIVALLLALLACSVQAYVSKFEYYAVGELRADYVVAGSQSNNRGRFLFRYEAASRTLNFHIISTLVSIGAVTLNGPYSCINKQGGGSFGQSSATCTYNTAPVVAKLGRGVVPATDEDVNTLQLFKGAITLDAVTESMLFRDELYLVMNIVDPLDKKKETPAIRSLVRIYDHVNEFYSYLIFENNKGQFPEPKAKTINAGFGLVRHNPATKVLNVHIYTTIKQTGTYFLKCSSGSKTLGQNNNPFEPTLTFTDAEAPLLLELLLDGSCYIFITSADAVDGDLFSKFHNMGYLEARSTGIQEVPPVQSPYISYSLATFDPSHKTLDILSKHNITDTITGAHVHAADGSVLCNLAQNTNLFPARSYCILNETSLPDLQKGLLYINVHTTDNPNGEVRGQLVFTTKKSTAFLRSSSGASSTSSLALGVGLGVGIPILVVAVVGVFFLAKRGGSGGKI